MHYVGFAGMIAGFPLTSVAQTNSPQPGPDLFVLTAPHLRAESVEASNTDVHPRRIDSRSLSSTSGATDVQSRLPSPFAASTGRVDTDFYLRRQDFGLILPKPMSHDPLTRGLDIVFRPEEFHFGRTATFSCSIATALKRKNPLCLLNPMFLNVSW